MQRLSDLSTVEEVLSNTYISAIGTPSINVEPIHDYRDSDGNYCTGFEITWENGKRSWVTYWEGTKITIAPKNSTL